APFALRLVVRTLGEATWEQLSIDALRLQLVGDAPLVAALYEMLLARCTRVIARPLDGGEGIVLPPSAVEPVGFEGDASLLPFPRRSFAGYALLQDYFAFPDRFMAIRIAELARVRALAPGRAVEFVLCCEATDRADWPTLLENGVRAQTFATSCVPVVNLFEQVAEPIRLTRRVHEYPIVPDAYRRRRLEVFGIDEVLVPRPGGGEPRVFLPLHAPRRGRAEVDVAGYWTAQRRTSEWRDGGADVFLAFVDADAEPIIPDASDVTVRLTCTDGTLPHQLRIPSDGRDFEILRGAPFVRIEALLRPTPHVPPPLGGAQAWRLLSLLSLNHRSLVDEGAEALRELLRLHDFARTRAAEEQVASLVRVTSRATHARIPSPGLGMTFVRGRAVELEFDEARLAGGSLYLLASVIERFLGLYVTINSFTQCTVRARQRQRVVRAWPPRSGWKPLV
nr:type VI secretion system baseplate subunit TssF [Gemmatimonadaceae bacterium]